MIRPNVPTFSTKETFLGIERHSLNSQYVVAGIPFDIGTSNRAGARFGPHHVRYASRMLVDGAHPLTGVNPVEMDISDIGNLDIVHGDIIGTLLLIEEQIDAIGHPITIGGDHLITLPILRSLHKKHGKIALVHFDAHVDTWPSSFGLKYGHGSVFYHAINEGLVDPNHMIQIGIRSPVDIETLDWTRRQGVTIVSATDMHVSSVADVAGLINGRVAGLPTYLTVDIDCLDPAFAPGTGTPEVGGLATWQLRAMLSKLESEFIGCDVVEVSPPYDVSEITALAAATIIYDYLCCTTKG